MLSFSNLCSKISLYFVFIFHPSSLIFFFPIFLPAPFPALFPTCHLHTHRPSSPLPPTRGPGYAPTNSDHSLDSDTHTLQHNAIQLSCEIVAHPSSGIPGLGPPLKDDSTDMPECPSKIASQYCYNIEVIESVGGEEGDGQEDDSDTQVRTSYPYRYPRVLAPRIVKGFQCSIRCMYMPTHTSHMYI
jgi:hypothetical protein